MRLGIIFPTTEIGNDPSVIRDFAQAVEGMGYDFLAFFDHVLGTDMTGRADPRRVFDVQTPLHEPLITMAYVAACTQRLGLATSILILPQRQTALVAKQVAELDVLSGGRIRLGVGNGWSEEEYESLNEDYHTRGRRMEEQIRLLKSLWSQETTTLEGQFHHIAKQGLNPMPVQRPIPIWLGGGHDAVLQRVARVADGWLPQMRPDDAARAAMEKLWGYVRAAGRDPKDIGIQANVLAGRRGPDFWIEIYNSWKGLGATDIAMNTMGPVFENVDGHLNALRMFKEAVETVER